VVEERLVMSIHRVIIAMGVLIALSVGSAIMLTNRYQVSQPLDEATGYPAGYGA